MNIDHLKSQLPDYAKDIKLNLTMLFSDESSQELTEQQIAYLSLALSFALKNSTLTRAISSMVEPLLDEKYIQAAKSAATIMAMNNIYYRFVHLAGDKSFASMPAQLRMNVIANSGIDKTDFELACLVVSAINGCGLCIESHTQALAKAGVSKLAIQFAIRLASVLNATSTSLKISKQLDKISA